MSNNQPIIVCLCVYAFLIPFDQVLGLVGGESSVALTRIAGYAVGIAIVVTIVARQLPARPPATALISLLLLLWIVLSALWAIDSGRVLKQLSTAASLLLLYASLGFVDLTDEDTRPVLFWCVAGGMLASVLSIWTYVGGTSYLDVGRASLIYANRQTNPNWFASSLLLPILTGFYFILEKRPDSQRIIWGTVLLPIVVAFLLAMSRGAFIGLLTGVLVISLRSSGRVKSVVAVVFVFCLILVMPPKFFDRFDFHKADSGAFRLTVWDAGAAALPNYWLVGAGFSNFPLVHGLWGNYTESAAHNIYLMTTVELGIIGAILLGLVLLTAWRGRRRTTYSKSNLLFSYESLFKAAAVGYLVAGIFRDNVWTKDFWFLWMLLGLVHRGQRWRCPEPAWMGPILTTEPSNEISDYNPDMRQQQTIDQF